MGSISLTTSEKRALHSGRRKQGLLQRVARVRQHARSRLKLKLKIMLSDQTQVVRLGLLARLVRWVRGLF